MDPTTQKIYVSRDVIFYETDDPPNNPLESPPDPDTRPIITNDDEERVVPLACLPSPVACLPHDHSKRPTWYKKTLLDSHLSAPPDISTCRPRTQSMACA